MKEASAKVEDLKYYDWFTRPFSFFFMQKCKWYIRLFFIGKALGKIPN